MIMNKKIQKKYIIVKGRYVNVFAIISSVPVIIFWRGVWGFLDIFLFPQNKLYSVISSITIGFVLMFFLDLWFNHLGESLRLASANLFSVEREIVKKKQK